jgi:ATPase subunit of ABC transporter with duplicated ATPase domains
MVTAYYLKSHVETQSEEPLITVNNLSLNFTGTPLFSNVNVKFTPGNCYGIIGANGAGKSTFLKILSGELEPTTGEVLIPENTRLSVLKQDHFAYDEYTVLDTIIMGNMRLYQIMKEKDALYAKADFSDEDGIRASELEAEFAELNGWEAETEASKLIQGLGLSNDLLYAQMNSLTGNEKVKILLAQALFGQPDIILLDEPTNHLDIQSKNWLEDFLLEYPGTIIVVSHDRHFLNTVCTHIADIDYGKIKIFVGNYDFWYESSQLIQRMLREQNKKNEEKAKELQAFIARFSANKSKSRQATSRKKLLEKLTIEDLPVSSRRYPYVGFQMDREPGKEILTVEGLSKTVDGVKVLNNVSFRVNKGDKIAFVGENEIANTTLFKILMGEMEPDEGNFKWGVSTSRSYFPKDNSEYFSDCDTSIIRWLEQYSKDKTDTYLRGFLGRMLFSGEDVFKPVNVLSGGEKVRCMLSRMMMFGANVLILDQPTNHLDLESITAVNNGLIDFKGIVLFASHDHQFIQTVANRIIEFTDEGMYDKMTTYEEYIELKPTLTLL